MKLLRLLVKLADTLIENAEYKERIGELDGARALLLALGRNCAPDLVGCTGDGYGSTLEAKKGLADYHAKHGIAQPKRQAKAGWSEQRTPEGEVCVDLFDFNGSTLLT